MHQPSRRCAASAIPRESSNACVRLCAPTFHNLVISRDASRQYERFAGLKSLPALGALCIVSAHRFRRQFQPKFAYARLILDEKGRSLPAPGLSLTWVKALDQGATG